RRPAKAVPLCSRRASASLCRFSIDTDQRMSTVPGVSSAFIQRRTNMPIDSLVVIVSVVAAFAFFVGVLAYATFDESRRQPDKSGFALVRANVRKETSPSSVRADLNRPGKAPLPSLVRRGA
ncbi:MAG: hypothetical protein ABJB10_16335, partial [Mesorhizobium sp.]